jgi:serine/threonine protein kinase
MERSQTLRKSRKEQTSNISKASTYSLSVTKANTSATAGQSNSSFTSVTSLALPTRSFKKIENKFIYFKKYVIGSGSFGKVLYGMNMERTEEFAIKFEKTTVKNSVIGEEIKILQDLQGGLGVPEIHWHGRHEEYKVIVMDLLGPSLDKFFKICGKKFNLETTVNMGIEMMNRIEYVHSKGYLHRDIKPNNFLLGKFSRNKVCDDNTMYIVDFGLSKSYLDEETNQHYDLKENRRFVGTPRYASLNTHVGIRQSRRDDIESIVYILIYFLKGELPWQGVKAKTKSEKKEKIKNQKKFVAIGEMCFGLPPQFNELLTYVKNLKFDEIPNYDHIRHTLQIVKNEYCFSDDYLNHEWEWNAMFFKSRQYKYKDEKIFNHFKKYYEKLYEGYPFPPYDDFLNYLENLNFKRSYKSVEALASTEEKTSETFDENKLSLANTPVSGNFKILIDLNVGTPFADVRQSLIQSQSQSQKIVNTNLNTNANVHVLNAPNSQNEQMPICANTLNSIISSKSNMKK